MLWNEQYISQFRHRYERLPFCLGCSNYRGCIADFPLRMPSRVKGLKSAHPLLEGRSSRLVISSYLRFFHSQFVIFSSSSSFFYTIVLYIYFPLKLRDFLSTLKRYKYRNTYRILQKNYNTVREFLHNSNCLHIKILKNKILYLRINI